MNELATYSNEKQQKNHKKALRFIILKIVQAHMPYTKFAFYMKNKFYIVNTLAVIRVITPQKTKAQMSIDRMQIDDYENEFTEG